MTNEEIEKGQQPPVWTFPAGREGLPMAVADDNGLIANCVRDGVSGFFQYYFLTEQAALDALRAHAAKQEAKWYMLIRQIDARVDEIETAEVKQ